MTTYSTSSPDFRPLKLALFDLDDTIISATPDELGCRAFWRMVEMGDITVDDATLDRLATLRTLYGSADSSAERRLYLDAINARIDKSVATISRARFKHIAQELVDDIFQPGSDATFLEVTNELHELQDEGVYTGIISGSFSPLVKKVAYTLGTDFAVGTQLYRFGSSYHPDRRESRGQNKHIVAERILARLTLNRLQQQGRAASNQTLPPLAAFDIADQFSLYRAYEDSVNGESMLRMADEPVVVAPKEELAVTAQLEDWRVIIPAQKRSIYAAESRSQ